MYGYGHQVARGNDSRQKLIGDIRKIETNANATLLTDTANMDTRGIWGRRNGYTLQPTRELSWTCENGHNITENFRYTQERMGSLEAYLCMQCSNQCTKCENEYPRTVFSKTVRHTTFYKTCIDCRDNMKTKRETNRVAKLVTKAKNPFEELDFNLIASLLNIVPKKRYKKPKVISLMFYRNVCTRFNEAIFDYADTLFNLDDHPKVKLLYLNKMHIPLNKNKVCVRIPLQLISAYLGEPVVGNEYSDHITYGDRKLTEGDLMRAHVMCFGSYDKSRGKTEDDVLAKMIGYFVSNGMPPLFC